MMLGLACRASLAVVLVTTLPSFATAADVLNPASFATSGPLELISGNYTINTSGGPGGAPTLVDSTNHVLATGALVNQGTSFDPTIGILDFDGVTIGSGVTITVTGSNPLALLSRGAISISGQILANGANGLNENRGGAGGAGGPGAGAGGVGGIWGSTYVGAPGQGPGGGPQTSAGLTGDAFGSGGGYGGVGTNGGSYKSVTYGDLATALLAGSGGSGAGANFFDNHGGGGGGGGGAVEFVAESSITLATGSLLQANGGQGGHESLFGYDGGGGSGGGLLLAAPSIAADAYQGIQAVSGFTGGGGGRVLFLTDTAALAPGSNGDAASVSAALYGNPGTIDYGRFTGFASGAVPEPGGWALMLAGFGAIGVSWRRRGALSLT